MTLYEILAVASPVLTVLIGGLLSHILNGLVKRIDNIDNRLGHLETEVCFIKGLIEGKNISSK
jgi:hypothetical protein